MIKDPETGIVYHSIKAFCKFKKIPYGTFWRAKYIKGYNVLEALNYTREVNNKYEDPYTGKKYRYLNEILRLHSEVSFPEVRRRLKKGMDLITAMKDIKPVFKDHLGNTFPSLISMAKFHKVNPNTLKGRLNAGYPIEIALSPMKLPRKRSERQEILYGSKSTN